MAAVVAVEEVLEVRRVEALEALVAVAALAAAAVVAFELHLLRMIVLGHFAVATATLFSVSLIMSATVQNAAPVKNTNAFFDISTQQYGFRDANNVVVIEPVGQYFLVGKSHKYGIIDAMGKEVVKLKLSREKAAEMLKTL